MTSTSSPPPYTAQPTITVTQKLELVQAELEVAKLRLRKQAGERQGKQRVASSRRAVLQRLVPRVRFYTRLSIDTHTNTGRDVGRQASLESTP